MSGSRKAEQKTQRSHSYVPTAVIGAAIALLAVLAVLTVLMNAGSPALYTLYNSETISYEKASVTGIIKETTEPAEGMPGWSLGAQRITARFSNGVMAGREIELDNILSTTHNIHVRKGTNIIIKADRPEGITPYYTVYSYDRTPGIIASALIFGALMLLVGRFKGLRSFCGLMISLLFIFAFLLPAIYRGWPPVPTAIAVVLVIAACSILLLSGLNQKSGAALLAVALGVLLSAFFFTVISALLSLTGYNLEEAEELILVSRATGLKIGEVLFAGVLVASIGAVIDMSVSVVSSMYEIREQRPDLSPGEIFRSGMTVGGDMIGSMSTTLILAFVGSSLATLLALMAYGSQLDQILSSDYAAVEIAYSLTSSLAVTVTVPVAAGLCTLLSGRARRKAAPGNKRQ